MARLGLCAALAALLAAGACAKSAPPHPAPSPPVLRGYGHGYPWTGYQQPYLGRP